MPIFLRNKALVQVENTQALEAEIQGLIGDDSARRALGERAARVVEENRGMIQKTVHLLDGTG